MTAFSSSIWDRLTGAIVSSTGHADPARLTPAQYQRVIARDLEALLNTRIATAEDELASYPACRDSILNFGLADFAQMCLNSSADRKAICAGLTAAIVRHEPRLCQVRARIVSEAGAINRLSFAISAQLRALPAEARVRFELMLEPSTLRYAIR